MLGEMSGINVTARGSWAVREVRPTRRENVTRESVQKEEALLSCLKKANLTSS